VTTRGAEHRESSGKKGESWFMRRRFRRRDFYWGPGKEDERV